MEISGISIREGVVIEKVLIVSRKKIKLEKRKIQSIKEEVNKFDLAVKKTVQELKEYKKYTEKNLGKNQAQIFEAHIEIAKDLQILNEVKNLIKTKKISAELAYESICKKYVNTGSSINWNTWTNNIIYHLKKEGHIRLWSSLGEFKNFYMKDIWLFENFQKKST